MDALDKDVMSIIAESVGYDPESIKPSDMLADDLDLDSIELVQLGQDLEEKFDIEIPDSAVQAHMTVADVAREVRNLMVARSA